MAIVLRRAPRRSCVVSAESVRSVTANACAELGAGGRMLTPAFVARPTTRSADDMPAGDANGRSKSAHSGSETRRARSFSRLTRMACSSGAGASGRSDRSGVGSSAEIAASTPATDSASNGNFRVNSSKSTTPIDQTSVRASTFLALRIDRRADPWP